MVHKLEMKLLDSIFDICYLDPMSDIPASIHKDPFSFISRTHDELSIVAEQGKVTNAEKRDTGWRCLFVKGTLDFSLVGILADISSVLAKEKISIFVVSTYRTDYIFVKEIEIDMACKSLKKNGYTID